MTLYDLASACAPQRSPSGLSAYGVWGRRPSSISSKRLLFLPNSEQHFFPVLPFTEMCAPQRGLSRTPSLKQMPPPHNV